MKPNHICSTALFTLHCTVALSIVVGGQTHAAVFDLQKDWSEFFNPHGVWTLRAGETVLPHENGWFYDLFSPNQGGWGTSIPFFFRSTSLPVFVHDWHPLDIIVHTQDEISGPGNGPANVLWTSPLTGQIDISGGVWEGREMDDVGGGLRGNKWNLYVRDILVSSGTIGGGDPYSSTNPFTFDLGSGGAGALSGIWVSINDVVRLELVRTSEDGDYVGINLQIATVSAPSLTILQNADQTVSLSWTGTGRLEQTESLTAPDWQPALVQDNPHTINTTRTAEFYRVKAE